MNNLKEKLINKVIEEQNQFIDWLKKQPAEEIINHSYEYVIREDIITAIKNENTELSESLLVPLINSNSPLCCIYDTYLKMDTESEHMEYISNAIKKYVYKIKNH